MPSCMEDKELLNAVESGEAISPELRALNNRVLQTYFLVMKRIQSHKKLFRFFKYVMFGSKTEKNPKDSKEKDAESSDKDEPPSGTSSGGDKKKAIGRQEKA